MKMHATACLRAALLGNEIAWMAMADIHLGSPTCCIVSARKCLGTVRCPQLLLVGDLWQTLGDVSDRVRLERMGHHAFIQDIETHPATTKIFCRGNHDPLPTDVDFLHTMQVVTRGKLSLPSGHELLVFHGDGCDSHMRFEWLGNI